MISAIRMLKDVLAIVISEELEGAIFIEIRKLGKAKNLRAREIECGSVTSAVRVATGTVAVTVARCVLRSIGDVRTFDEPMFWPGSLLSSPTVNSTSDTSCRTRFECTPLIGQRARRHHERAISKSEAGRSNHAHRVLQLRP